MCSFGDRDYLLGGETPENVTDTHEAKLVEVVFEEDVKFLYTISSPRGSNSGACPADGSSSETFGLKDVLRWLRMYLKL